MSDEKQNENQIQVNNNGQNRAHLTLLVLILGILSIASIGILTLAMLRQMYPKVFAAPGIAKQLNYQGKLQDAGGTTVPDGTYGMQFTIYDSAAGGNILWTARESDACGAPFNPATKSISTYNGIFSTLLGEAGDCPVTLDFADDAYYLGVTVGADPEMTPRKRIGAAGYAFNADLLDGLNTSNAGGTNAFVPVTDSSGNLFLTKDFTVTSNEVGAQAIYGAATDTSATINYGGYFTAAGTSFAAGVWGEATGAGTVYGVVGSATDSTAVNNYGGAFQSYGTGLGAAGARGTAYGAANNVYGVQGQANSTGAYTNYGGYFLAQGETGRGVYGEANNTAVATNYGGYFTAAGSGPSTTGVYGIATDTTASNYGGYFQANGLNGSGVYAKVTDTTGVNYAVTAETSSPTGYGVYAYDLSGTGLGYGVWGGVNSPDGYGVKGETGWGTGTGRGIYGATHASGGYGVYGSSDNPLGGSYAVYGSTIIASDWAGYFTGGYGVYTDKDFFAGSTSEGITNAGFTTTGLGSGYFNDKLGANSDIYTNSSFIAGTSTTYSNGTITTSASDLVVTPAGGEMTVVGNIESLATPSFNPVLKASLGTTGNNPLSIHVSGKYAYVASGNSSTLEIYDVTNPTSPAAISSVATGGGAYGVYVSGKYAYVINGSGFNNLQIYDISNPLVPVLLGSAPLAASPQTVYVSGHYAYVPEIAPNGFEIVDVSNPAVPWVVGSMATISSPNDLYVSGTYAYLAEAGGPVLEVVDISDPTAPASFGSAIASGQIFSVYVSGRYAYTVNLTTNILEIFDISNPAVPVSVGSAATSANPFSIYVSGRYAYTIAGSPSNILEVFDVSNVATPVKVGSASTNIAPYALYVSGRYAYTVCLNATNTLQIFDVSGLEVTSGMVHSLEVGNLQVRNDIIGQGELSVDGGLNVGGTGFFNDSLSVHSIGPVGGYFQTDGSGATGLLGYTTNSFSNALYGLATGSDSAGITAAAGSTTGNNTGGSFSAGTGSTVISGTGHTMGVHGYADGGAGINYGGVFAAGNLVSLTIAGSNNIGVAGFAEDSAGTNYGVYGAVSGSGWAGYFTGGDGLYANRLSIADSTSGTAYNTIGTPATSHALAAASDLFIAGNLEVDGASWFDGGHTDLAEMINYTGGGEAGDVIVIDEENDNTAHLADEAYDPNVIGIISTNPSLIITGDIKDGKLLAVAGRVPTKVTALNGPIGRGDLLTTSTKPGYAMKATEPGPIVGKALEPCLADSCTIWVFLNVGWYGGVSANVAVANTPVSYTQTVVSDKLTANLDANGFAINNISKITAVGGKWSIDENGLLKNRVEFTRDNETVKKDIYALSSTGAEIVLSGSGKLDKGEILVDFSQVDKDFSDITNTAVSLKISVTPTEACQGMYVAEKYPQGFKVKEFNGGTSNATFDWIVIGQRKGYETAAEKQ